jgi:hypothetical protein
MNLDKRFIVCQRCGHLLHADTGIHVHDYLITRNCEKGT